jgi:hypothetical protein
VAYYSDNVRILDGQVSPPILVCEISSCQWCCVRPKLVD